MAIINVIYIDGVNIADTGETIGTDVYSVTSTGFAMETGTSRKVSGHWTYSGEGTFLGLSLTEGATTPDPGFAVGDSGSYDPGHTVYFYSVSSSAPSSPPPTYLRITHNNITTTHTAAGTYTLTTAGTYLPDDITIEVKEFNLHEQDGTNLNSIGAYTKSQSGSELSIT